MPPCHFQGRRHPFRSPFRVQTVVNLSTDTSGWFSVGAVAVPDPNPISDAYFLQLSEAIVPPGEMLLIEVGLAMNYFSSDGNVLIDCSSGTTTSCLPLSQSRSSARLPRTAPHSITGLIIYNPRPESLLGPWPLSCHCNAELASQVISPVDLAAQRHFLPVKDAKSPVPMVTT